MRHIIGFKNFPKSLGEFQYKTAIPIFFGVLLFFVILLFVVHLFLPEDIGILNQVIDLFTYMLLFVVLFIPLYRDHRNLQKTDAELQEIRKGLEERVRERTRDLETSYEQIRLQLTAMESAADGILITGKDGVIEWCNAAMTHITGYDSHELVGQSLSVLKSGMHPPEFYLDLWQTILQGKTWRGVIINRRKDHRLYYEEQTITPVANPQGQIERFVAIKHDITERRQAEQELILHNWELRTLNFISRQINGSLEEPVIYKLLAELLPQEVPNLGGTIDSRDPVSGALSRVIGWGSAALPGAAAPGPDPRVQAAVREAIQEQKVYFVPAPPPGEAAAPSNLAHVVVPLVCGESVLGVLALQFDSLENRHIHYFKALGNQIGAAIQNARLYQQEINLRRMAEIISSANQSLVQTLDLETVLQSMFQFLSTVVPYEYGDVMLVDGEGTLKHRARSGSRPKGNTGRLVPPLVHIEDHPLLARILEQKAPVLVSDTRSNPVAGSGLVSEGARSWLGLPLRTGGQVIGTVILEGRQAGQFSAAHITAAVLLVDQAAIAIQNAWLFDQLREGGTRLQMLSRRLVEIQESERKYIARELHDEASQALVGLKFGLGVLRSHAADPAAVAAETNELETRVVEILENLHRLASNLRPASLDHLGLVPALRQFIAGIHGKYGIHCDLRVEGPMERLPHSIEINLYRIVQEALVNIVRHARASKAEVFLRKAQGCLTASIMDDGVGFNPETAGQGDRLGLFGMRERVEMIGGKIRIYSVPGEGTTIFVEIPDVHSNFSGG